jgi:hypothetical protein
MEFNYGMLQEYLPREVYKALINDVEETDICEEDWNRARVYMLNLSPSGCARSWDIIAVRDFTQEEMDLVRYCEVHNHTIGMSMVFCLKNGEHASIPLTSDPKWNDGDRFDIHNLQLLSLGNNYSLSVLYRVDIKGRHEDIMNHPDYKAWKEWTKKVWYKKLNPLRHKQWDRMGIHTAKMFRDVIPY